MLRYRVQYKTFGNGNHQDPFLEKSVATAKLLSRKRVTPGFPL
jgi:hypothetical protein